VSAPSATNGHQMGMIEEFEGISRVRDGDEHGEVLKLSRFWRYDRNDRSCDVHSVSRSARVGDDDHKIRKGCFNRSRSAYLRNPCARETGQALRRRSGVRTVWVGFSFKEWITGRAGMYRGGD